MKKSYGPPVGKIDLNHSPNINNTINSTNETDMWKEANRFFDYWRITPIKSKP